MLRPHGPTGRLPPRPRHRHYKRHRPETTALYELVRDNLDTLYGAIGDGVLDVKLPERAKKELEAYLDCGLPPRAAVRPSRPRGPHQGKVREQPLLRSEELLLAHGASVAEAAFAVGFSETAPFSRAFRRWTGTTPSELVRSRGQARSTPTSPPHREPASGAVDGARLSRPKTIGFVPSRPGVDPTALGLVPSRPIRHT